MAFDFSTFSAVNESSLGSKLFSGVFRIEAIVSDELRVKTD